MKVTIESRKEELFEEYDYRDYLKIKFDGKVVFNVRDGEPEDSNLGRDFNDCWKISELLKLAYDAGKRGEPLDFESTSGEY
jgi:hypothetical protein